MVENFLLHYFASALVLKGSAERSSPSITIRDNHPPLMSKTYFTRKRGALLQLSEQEHRRLKNVSDAEAETRASSDPDNPPLTEERLTRMVLAREVRLVRE
jgi:hypothetical protein